jgi:hypothetical protein
MLTGKQGIRRLWQILGLHLFTGIVAFMWAAAWHVLASAPEPKGVDGEALSLADRTTIALTALAITIGVLTLMVGGLALVGWDKLEKTARRDVEESLSARIEKLENLMQGRVLSMLDMRSVS